MGKGGEKTDLYFLGHPVESLGRSDSLAISPAAFLPAFAFHPIIPSRIRRSLNLRPPVMIQKAVLTLWKANLGRQR